MSYTPTVWKDGDVVTSTKLNKLEQGVAAASGGGGSAFIVDLIWDDTEQKYTTETGIADILAAAEAGKSVMCRDSIQGSCTYFYLSSVNATDDGGEAMFVSPIWLDASSLTLANFMGQTVSILEDTDGITVDVKPYNMYVQATFN